MTGVVLTRLSKRVHGAWIAGACLVGALHALRVYQATVSDDAFILYRYARNLAHGSGLVWNVGERPIEGFTSLLAVLGLAAGHSLGLDLVLEGQICGVAFAALTCAAAAWLGREVGAGDLRVGSLAAWAVALSPPLAAWARGGMETSLFSFLLTASMAMWMSESRAGSGRWRTCAMFLLSSLARPEAMAIALLAFGFDAGARRKSWVAWWPYAVGMAGLASWRLWYFGDFLPNTFYAKTGGGVWALQEGALYVARFLRAYGTVNLLLIVVPAILIPSVRGSRTGYVLASLGLLCVHVASVGGDYQYFGRYLVPILPWLGVLTALGGVTCYDAMHAMAVRRRVAATAVVALAGAGQLLLVSLSEVRDRPWLIMRPWRLVRDTDPALFRRDFELMGEALRRIASPNDTVAALAVGAIGYYSDRPILDCLGLNDRQIARLPVKREGRSKWLPGHMRGDANVILARRPEIVVVPMRPTADACASPAPSHVATYPFVGELLAMPEFRRSYRQRSYPLPDGRWLNYFEREPAKTLPSSARECGSDVER